MASLRAQSRVPPGARIAGYGTTSFLRLTAIHHPAAKCYIMNPSRPNIDIEKTVHKRYSTAAIETQTALCCPVEYDDQYLEILPKELIDRDYGCGDPSKYVRPGETVLDLGSGGGKICYIASQIVGPEGRVVGVDQNDEMLSLARRFQNEVGERIGWHNTEFYKGHIQDLALDLERFEAYLGQVRDRYKVNVELASPDLPRIPVSVDDDPAKGPKDAPITPRVQFPSLREFSLKRLRRCGLRGSQGGYQGCQWPCDHGLDRSGDRGTGVRWPDTVTCIAGAMFRGW